MSVAAGNSTVLKVTAKTLLSQTEQQPDWTVVVLLNHQVGRMATRI